MKKVLLFTLLLLCAVFSSCEKAKPSPSLNDLLIGTWEVSTKTTYTLENGETSVIDTPYLLYYTFYTSGDGRIVYPNDSLSFTYVFDTTNKTIILTLSKSSTSVYWNVDKLTEDTLICHSEDFANMGGKRLKAVSTMNGKKSE